MSMTVSPSISRHVSNAFSLIEIVLTLGIISFALVGILGLFPAALNSATDSRRETHSALIARSIFNDLESESGSVRHLQVRVMSASSESLSEPQVGIPVPINLAAPESEYLAYDSQGLLLKKSSTSAYSDGLPEAGYMARISVRPIAPLGLSQLQVTISAPGNIRAASRASYEFFSQLNQ